MVDCKYLTEEPYNMDVYKSPEIRYLCRCVERNNTVSQFSDRFVGGEQDCESCPFKTPK